MNLLELVPPVFAAAAGALAVLTLVPLPGRTALAYAVAALGMVLGSVIFLQGMYAVLSGYPFASVSLLAVVRGSYAWLAWLHFAAVVASQCLWQPKVRAQSRVVLMIALACVVAELARPVAGLVWGSR